MPLRLHCYLCAPPRPLRPPPPHDAHKQYVDAMEYAAALEEHINKLTAGDSVPSALPAGTSTNEESSALTTGTTGTAGPLIDALRKEMREQTTTATLQMAMLTAAIAAVTTSGGKVGERKQNRDSISRKNVSLTPASTASGRSTIRRRNAWNSRRTRRAGTMDE